MCIKNYFHYWANGDYFPRFLRCNRWEEIEQACFQIIWYILVDLPYDTLVDLPYNTLVDLPYDTLVDLSYNTLVDLPYDTLVDLPYNTLVAYHMTP